MATTKIKIKRGPIESFVTTSNTSVRTGTENELFMSTESYYRRLFMSDGTEYPIIINPVVRYNHSYMTDIHTGSNADSDGFKSYPILFSNVADVSTKGFVEDFVFVNGSDGVASTFKVVFSENAQNHQPSCHCGSSVNDTNLGQISLTEISSLVYSGTVQTNVYLGGTYSVLWFSFNFGYSTTVVNVKVEMGPTGVIKFYEFDSDGVSVTPISELYRNLNEDNRKKKGYDAMECSFNYALNVRKREVGNNKYFIYYKNLNGTQARTYGIDTTNFTRDDIYEQNLIIGGFNKDNYINTTDKSTFGTLSLKYMKNVGTITNTDTDAIVTLIPNTSRGSQDETNVLLPTESCELVGHNPQLTRYHNDIIGTYFNLDVGPEKYANSVVVGNDNFKTVDFVRQDIDTSVTSDTDKVKLFADIQTYREDGYGNINVTTHYGWVDKDTITGGESVTYNPLASDSLSTEDYVVTGGGNGTQLLNGNGEWVSGKNVEISDTTVETIADNTVAETYEYGRVEYIFNGSDFDLHFNKFSGLLRPDEHKTFEYFFDFSVLFSDNEDNPSFINIHEFFDNVSNSVYSKTPKKLTINLYNIRETLRTSRKLGLIIEGEKDEQLVHAVDDYLDYAYPIVWSDEDIFQIKLYTEPVTFKKTYTTNYNYQNIFELKYDFAHINRYLLEYVLNGYIWQYKDFVKFDVIQNYITDEKEGDAVCYHIIPYANSGLCIFPSADYPSQI